MPQIANFAQMHAVLNKFIPRGAQPGSYSLKRMQDLMTKLGNPQDEFKTVHIAGTSGKSSTCYYAAALLSLAGKKVGLTVSPHVDEVNERVQIDLKPLPEKTFCQKLGEFINTVSKTGVEPTYFELLVAFAYWEFARQGVDYAVVEVGLGGLLDGTNVMHSPDKVCVITDIGLDHTNVLGNSLGEIATQKAGVIQSHNPVFMYTQSAEVMSVVRDRCAQEHAQLHELTDSEYNASPDLPPFQQRNWHLAKSVYDFVAIRDKLAVPSSDQITKAEHTRVPARMEVINFKGKTLIIDGSHNGQKMAALVEGVQKLYPGQPSAALVSFVRSESERAQGALAELAKLGGNLIVTSFAGQQDTPKHSVQPGTIAAEARQAGYRDVQIVADPKTAFAKLMQQDAPVLIVTGSFYLLNHIRPLIFKS